MKADWHIGRDVVSVTLIKTIVRIWNLYIFLNPLNVLLTIFVILFLFIIILCESNLIIRYQTKNIWRPWKFCTFLSVLVGTHSWYLIYSAEPDTERQTSNILMATKRGSEHKHVYFGLYNKEKIYFCICWCSFYFIFFIIVKVSHFFKSENLFKMIETWKLNMKPVCHYWVCRAQFLLLRNIIVA